MVQREAVVVPIHTLVEKALPPVCAVSGVPTHELVEYRFSDSSLLRALTAAFVRAEHRRQFVTGLVPLASRLVAWRQRLRLVAVISAVSAMVAGVIGVATQAAGPITVMVALLGIASLALIVRATLSPQGVLQGQYVWLTRAHPAFADAAIDLVHGVRRLRDDEEPVRAGIGPVPMRAVVGIMLWLFVIVWIAIR